MLIVYGNQYTKFETTIFNKTDNKYFSPTK